jgi:hypothetical protein
MNDLKVPIFRYRPKFVHLTNEQFYEPEATDAKEGYDLSTSASSSSTNTITTSHTALNRLMQHDESVARSHLEASEGQHNGASTSKKSLKHSPSQHHYTNSSNLVTVMMDDKSHDTTDEHSFYMPLRRDIENGHHPMEYEEGKDLINLRQKLRQHVLIPPSHCRSIEPQGHPKS